MFQTLSDFYRSKEWKEFRENYIATNRKEDGFVYDEVTGKPIVKKYDIILHHKTELTLDNVNDCNITLNPENIMIVSFKTHNDIHKRFGRYTRHVYLVYGCPLAGKSFYVKERAGIHDLIIDVDKIYECITNNPLYIKSDRLYDCKQAVQKCLLDCVKYKVGKWINVWIIGGYPYKGERERMAAEYGCEEVFIECDKETALNRLEACQDSRDKKEWTKHIETWFNRYSN